MPGKKNEHVRFVLDDLLKKWDKEKVGKGKAVREAWVYAAGEKTVKQSKPVSLKKGVLVVVVEDTSWLYRLTLEKRTLLSKFNEKYPGRKKAVDIRFRVGSLDE